MEDWKIVNGEATVYGTEEYVKMLGELISNIDPSIQYEIIPPA